MNDQDVLQKKLLETFKVEANEHLRSLVNGLMQLEHSPNLEDYAKIVEMLHRETHNLKGAARAVNLLEINSICQSIELIVRAWKKEVVKPSKQQFDVLYNAISIMQQALTKNNISVEKNIVDDIVDRLNKLPHEKTFSPPTSDTTISTRTPLRQVFEDVSQNIQTVRIAASKLDAMLLKSEEMVIIKLISQKYVNEMNAMLTFIGNLKKQWNRDINSLNNQIEFNNKCLESIKYLEKSLLSLASEFENNTYQFNLLIDRLLENVKNLVLLPFASLLDNFPMMVRSLGKEEGKDINLIIQGAEIEIDKRILDELKDLLIHIIRNCIDHGIEKPENRKNKPPQGTIKIEIYQFVGYEAEIIISDDGAGIDLDAVKKNAIQKNFISANDADKMNDQEILSLIYLSGISTSSEISSMSGQGLGMAIVRDKIENIGGHVEIKTHKDEGTEIKLTFPLTLSTYKGILIKSGNQTFVLPTAHLEKIIRIRPEEIKTVENKETILIDSHILAFARLNNLLGLNHLEEIHTSYLTVIILKTGNNRAAFKIDEVFGEQEILVKKLDKPLIKVKYIAAATILEDGIPVPILSTTDLIHAVIKGTLLETQTLSKEDDVLNKKTILVVEDSITTRTLFKNVLEVVGYTVLVAVDGQEALNLLKIEKIDLVVSDIEMPNLNGLELTKKIRQDEKLSSIPVILITSRESAEDHERGIDAGANAYIDKSKFNDSNLITTIQRLI